MTDDVDSVVYRAEALLTLGRTDQADARVRGALSHRPDDPTLLFQLQLTRCPSSPSSSSSRPCPSAS